MTKVSTASSDAPTRTGVSPTAADDSRERILHGAVRSIARHGLERSSIASVAREAGVSRQTIYAYYTNREDVLRDAVMRSATDLMRVVVANAKKSSSAGEFLVELTAGVIFGVKEHPALSAMLYSVDSPEGREMTMSGPILEVVEDALAPLAEYDPALKPKLGVIAETSLRLTVSLLTFPSERTSTPARLRAYLAELTEPLAR